MPDLAQAAEQLAAQWATRNGTIAGERERSVAEYVLAELLAGSLGELAQLGRERDPVRPV